AVHDDISDHRRWYLRFIRKLGWLVVGLLAPEFLLYIAVGQFAQARSILKEAERTFTTESPSPSWFQELIVRSRFVRKLFGIPESNPGSPNEDAVPLVRSARDAVKTFRRHRWTMTHAFYATMGGFRLDVVDESGSHYLPAWQSEGIISPFGILFLMKHEPTLIPDISVADIWDKSKADGLAKALLIWQLLWFITNVGNRLGHGLPLSLLEVTTISHGLCTLWTYVLWWSKPLGVREATVITGASQLGAWMTMLTPLHRYMIEGLMCFRRDPEIDSLDAIQVKDLLEAALRHQRSVEKYRSITISITLPERGAT
ncbi:uncharacterized protein B0H18DRAFT_1165244, partial [Fomitopsis serialis]|uniref:uncharacterized protein n=1 Tax=Fomitopsis serialis TaxID=139415 RepID=UPI0020081B62